MQVALVVGQGVLGDECDAFRETLPAVHGLEFVHVGAQVGDVAGPGGVQPVDATYDEVADPDVVVVPGTLGCARAAADPAVRAWLRLVAPTSRWVVASSTGPVVVGAAGLLDGHRAVAHWLAIALLDRCPGVTVVRGPSVLRSGKFLTCTGRVSAHEAALAVVRDLAGDDAADRAAGRPSPAPAEPAAPVFIELTPVGPRPDRWRSRHTPW